MHTHRYTDTCTGRDTHAHTCALLMHRAEMKLTTLEVLPAEPSLG